MQIDYSRPTLSIFRPFASARRKLWQRNKASLLALVLSTGCVPLSAPDPFAGSELAIDKDAVPADGVTRAALSLSLRDGTGTPLPQVPVTFVTNANVVAIQPGVTDANGQAQTLITSTVAGPTPIGVQAQSGGTWSTLSQTATVTFTDPNLALPNVQLMFVAHASDAAVADGNSALFYTVSVTDDGGQPVVGMPVTITSDGDGDTLEPGTGVLDSLGTFTTSVRSTRSGSKTLTATVAGHSAQAIGVFKAGSLSATRSRLSVLPSSILANSASLAVVTLTSVDAFDNPIGGVVATFSTDDPNSVVTPPAATSNSLGIATATVTSNRIGTTTVRASLRGASLSVPIQVTATRPSGLYSRLVVPQRSVQADGISQVRLNLTVYDVSQQRVPNQPVVLTSTDPGDSFVPDRGVTDANGVFSGWLTSQHAGAKSVLASFADVAVGTTATFVALDADAGHSTFVASPTQLPADAVSPATLTLQARDLYGNPASYEPISLSADSPDAVFGRPVGQTDSAGIFSTTVTSPTAGNVLVVASLRSTELGASVQFTAGSPTGALSTLVLSPNSTVADGRSRASVAAMFVDALGNRVSDCNTTFTSNGASLSFVPTSSTSNRFGMSIASLRSTIAQQALVSATCQGVSVSAPMRFVAGPADVAQSAMRPMPNAGIADGNSKVALVVSVRDAQQNPCPAQTVALSGDVSGMSLQPASGTTDANGNFVSFVSSSVATTGHLRASVGSVVLQADVPFVAGAPSFAQSSLVATPATVLADGFSSTRLALSLVDRLQNPVALQNVTFVGSGNELFVTASTQTDAQGKAYASVASTVAKTSRLTAVVAGGALSANVAFVPGPPSATLSALSVINQTAVADGQTPLYFQACIADASGNAITGATVTINSSNPLDIVNVVSTTTNAEGLVTGGWTSTIAGERVLEARVNGIGLNASARFVAGAVATSRSSLVLSNANVVADGVSTTQATVLLQDAFGNPAGAQQVRFAMNGIVPRANSDASPDFVSDEYRTTTADGRASVTLRSTLAERKTVVASFLAQSLTAQASFVAGAANVAHSSLTAVPPVGLADNQSGVLLQLSLADAYDNPIAGAVVRATSDQASDTLLQNSNLTGPVGRWQAQLASGVAGTRVVSVQADTQMLSVPVTLLSGPPSALSSLHLTPSLLAVDSNVAISVVVRAIDAMGNAAANRPILLQASGPSAVLSPNSGVTDEDGLFRAQLTAQRAGAQTITATLDPNGFASLSDTVTFVAGLPSATHSHFDVTPIPSVAGLLTTVTGYLRDKYDNPLANLPLSLRSDLPADEIVVDGNRTGPTGDVRATAFVTTAGLRTLSVDLDGLTAQGPWYVLAAPADANFSNVVANPPLATADGASAVSLLLIAKDRYGNPAGNQFVSWQVAGAGAHLSTSEGTTDASGTLQVSLTSTTSGTKTLEVMVGNAMLQVPVVFVAGAASELTSVLSAAPATLVADGNQQSVLTLAAIDALGNPVAGQQVLFSSSDASDVLQPTIATTDATGQCNVRLSATTAAAKVVSAQFGSVNATSVITAIPGLPSSANSTLFAVPGTISTDGNSLTTLSVQLRDAHGNPVAQAPVTWNAPLGTQLLTSTSLTDAQGRASATVSATLVGTRTLTVTAGSPNAFVLSAPVSVAAGSPSAATTTLLVSPNVVLANGQNVATVRVLVSDALGNPAANQNVSLQASGSNFVLSSGAGASNANGVWSTTVRSTLAQAQTLTARVGTLTVQAPLTFVAGVPSAASSSLVANLSAPIADGVSALVITARVMDAFGNPVSGQLVSLSSSGLHNTLSPSSCTTAANGTCELALRTTTAGTKVLSAAMGDANGTLLTTQVTFAPGVAGNACSTVSLSPSQVVADGNTPMNVAVQVRDTSGNPVGNQLVHLQVQGVLGTFLPADGTTDANGLFSSALRTSQAGAALVTANFASAAATANGLFVPGPISLSQSLLLSVVDPVLADGVHQGRLTVTALDAQGNPVANANVRFSASGTSSVFSPVQTITDAAGFAQATVASSVAETKVASATFDNGAITQAIHFVAGAAVPQNSTLTASPNSLLADGNAALTLSLVLRDATGNPVGNEPVQLTAAGGNVSMGPQPATSDSAGRWQAVLRSTQAQAMVLTTTAGSLSLSVPVTWLPGPASQANSVLSAAPRTVLADGLSQSLLLLSLKDAFGNPLPNVPIAVSASGNNNILGSGMTDALGLGGTVFSSTEAGHKQVVATAQNYTFFIDVDFVAGAPVSQQMSLTATPNVVVADGNARAHLRFVVADAQGNPVANQVVDFATTGVSNALTNGNCVTNYAGCCNTFVSSSLAQNELVTASIGLLSTSVALQFVPGSPNASRSSLIALPSTGIADGNTPVQLVATLRDATGNAVPGFYTAFAATGTGATLGATGGTSDATGQVATSLRSSVARTQAASVLAGALSANVPFVAGAISPATTALSATPNALIADGVTTAGLSLQATDALGNPISGLSFSFHSLDAADVFVPPVRVTDGNGYVQVAVASTHSGSRSLTASTDGASFSAVVQFVPGVPTDANVFLTALPAVASANGVAKINVALVATDAFGNAIGGAPVQFSASGANNIFSALNANTDATGAAAVTLASTLAQAQNVSASLVAGGSTLSKSTRVTFVAGAINDALSTLVISPNSAIADGNSPLTVTLLVRDSFGNPVGSQAVTLQGAGLSSANGILSGTSDAAGVWTTQLVSTTSGVKAITASVAGGSINANALFVPGPVDATRSVLLSALDTITADGIGFAQLTAWAKDARGNPVAGAPVHFAATGSNNIFSVAQTVTDSQGRAQTSLQSSRAETKGVDANFATANLHHDVVFVAGAPSALTSSLSLTPNSLVADGLAAASLTLQLVDALNNPVANQNVSWSTSGANITLSPSANATDALGQAHSQLQSVVAQSALVTASIGALQLSQPIVLGPGAASISNSTLQATPPSVTADGTTSSVLALSLRDAHNNPLANTPVAFSSSGTANVLGSPNALTTALGVATTTLQSTFAETKLVTASAAGISLQQNVQFIAGAPSEQNLMLSATPNSLLADNQATALVRVSLSDAYGNAVANQNVSVSTNGVSSTLSATSGVTDANGTFVTALRSSVAQTQIVTATTGSLSTTTQIQFVPGVPTAGQSSLTPSPTWGVADGNTPVTLWLLLRDATGNAVPNASASFVASGPNATLSATSGTSNQAGVITAMLRANSAGPQRVSALGGAIVIDVPFVAGPLNANQSSLSVGPSVVVADGVQSATLTVQARDSFGNPVVGQNVQYSSIDGQAVFAPQSQVTDANGQSQTSVRSISAGRTVVTGSIGGVVVSGAVTFVAGAPAAQNTTLMALPSFAVADGQTKVRLALSTADAYGNPVINAPVTFTAAGGNNVLSATTANTDATGSASVTLASTQAQVQVASASVTNQNVSVTANTNVSFVSGMVDDSRSTLALSPNLVVADGNAVMTATLMVRDAFGNAAANQPVSLQVQGAATVRGSSAATTDATGMWQASLVSFVAGSDVVTASVAGGALVATGTFVPGPPSSARSVLVSSLETVTADGTSAAQLTTWVKDAQNNPVPNAPVRFSSSGSRNTFSVVSTTTNAQGLALSTLSSSQAESKLVDANFVTGSANHTVSFVASAPSLLTSTWSASPNVIVANGNQVATLSLSVRDVSGNPVANQGVVATSGNAVVLSPNVGVTNASGLWQTSLSGTQAQLAAVQAATGGLLLTTSVQLVPGAPSVGASVLTAAPAVVTADGQSTSTAVLSLFDARGNAVPNVPVVFSSTGEANLFGSGNAITDATGTASTTVRSTKAQSEQVTASAAGLSWQAPLTFVAGAPSQQSLRLVASPNVLVADGVATSLLRYVVADAQANPIANQLVSFVSSGTGNVFGATSCVTDANGACTTTFRSTKAEDKGVTASSSGLAQSILVSFLPGSPSAAQSSFAASPHVGVADGNTPVMLTLLLRDAQGNVVPGAQVTLSASGLGAALSQSGVTTDAQGIATAQLTATQAGTVSASTLSGALVAQVPFVAGAANAARSSLSATPNQVMADGNCFATLSLVASDALGNAIGNQPVQFSSLNATDVFVPPSGVTDANGRLTARVSAVQAGPKTLTAVMGASYISTSATFVAGPPSAARVLLSALPTSVIADGVAKSSLVLSVSDAQANPIALAPVQFTTSGGNAQFSVSSTTTDASGVARSSVSATRAQTLVVSASITASGVTQIANANVQFVAGSANVVSSSVVISPNMLLADNVQTAQLKAMVLDGFGNPVANQTVTPSATYATCSPAFGPTDANGRFACALRSTVAGVDPIYVAFGSGVLSSPVTFLAGAPSQANTTLIASPGVLLADGLTGASLLLSARDAFGNAIAGQNVTFSLSGSGASVIPLTAVTSASGQAQASVSATRAQTLLATATLSPSGITASAPITFVAGLPASHMLSMTFSPNTMATADGASTTFLSAYVADAFGNAVANQNVSIASMPNDVGGLPVAGVTDANGLFTASISSTKAGRKSLALTAGLATTNGNFSFVAGSPNAARSSFVGPVTATLADGASAASFTATIQDAFGNPVPSAAVQFSSNSNSDVLTPTISTTNTDGVATTVLKSTVAQTKTVVATSSAGAQSANAVFVSGSPNSARSSVVCSPNAVAADGNAAILCSVSAQDAFGNPAANQTVAITLSGVGATAFLPSGTTASNGTWSTSVTSTVAQTKTITANVGTASVATTVTFLAGSPNGSLSSFTAAPAQVTANGNNVANLQLRLVDSFGNPTANQPVSLSSNGAGAVFVPPSGTTNAAGVFIATVSSLVQGNQILTATTGAQSFAAPLAFLPGAVSSTVSTLVALPSPTVANGNAQMVVSLTAKDAVGNLVPNQAVGFGVNGSNNRLSSSTGTTNSLGLSEVTLSSTTAENKLVTATLGGTAISVVAPFVAGTPNSLASSLVSSLSSVTADNVSATTLTVTVRDGFGNPVQNQLVTFSSSGGNNTLSPNTATTNALGVSSVSLTSSLAQNKFVQASFGGAAAAANVLFVPGSPNAVRSSLVADKSSVVADGNARATLTLSVLDAYGNPLANQAVTLVSSGANDTLAPSSGVTNAAGVLSATLSSTSAQNKSITASVNTALTSTQVLFIAGPISPNNSLFLLSPPTLVADGVSTTVLSLSLQDAQRNVVTGQNVTYSVSDTANVTSANSNVTDGLGQWRATLASSHAATKTVVVQAGNLTFGGNATFLPGAASAQASSFVISPNVVVADGNAAFTLRAVLRDAQGNPLANQTVALSASGSTSTLLPPSGLTDGNGLFTAQLSSTTAETKIVSANSGIVNLSGTAPFVPGSISVLRSSLTASPNAVTADGGSRVVMSLLLKDAFDNALANVPVSWSHTARQSVLSVATTPTNAAGQASSQLASTAAQMAQVVASAGAQNFSVPVSFVVGPVASTTSSLALSPNVNVVANGNSTVGLTVFVGDAQGNPVGNQLVSASSTGSNNVFTPAFGTTDGNGLWRATLSSTTAQTKAVSATIGSGATSVSLLGGAYFVAGPASAANSTLVATPAIVTADGVTNSTLSVTVADAFGNAIGAAPIFLVASGSATALSPNGGIASAAGGFSATVTSTQAQNQIISATLGGAGGPILTVPISFKPGAVSTAASSFVTSPNVVIASATDNANVVLTLLDAQRNPVPNVAVAFTTTGGTLPGNSVTDANGTIRLGTRATVAQTATLTAYFGSASLVNTLTIVAGPPSATTSIIVASPTSTTADGNKKISLVVTSKDAFGNLTPSVPVALSSNGAANLFGALSGNTTVGGQFSSTISSSLAQTESVIATLGVTPSVTVSAPIAFLAGPPVLANSSFVVSPNVFVANNVAQASFIATVRDEFGNPVPNQNVSFAVSGNALTLSAPIVSTGANGNAIATLRSTLVQPFAVTANVNNMFSFSGSAQSVPGPTARLGLVGLAGGTAAATSAPSVTAWDAFNNATPAYNGTVAFSSTDAAAVLPSAYTFSTSDFGARTFVSGATLVTPGSQTVTVTDVNNASLFGSQSNIVVTAPIQSYATLRSQSASALCLDLLNGSTSNATPVVATVCSGLINEVFLLGTDNTVQVMGNCMEVTGGTYAAGQAVQASACTLTPQQRWSVLPSGQIASIGNPNYCLDIGAGTSGTQAVINACASQPASQLFAVRSVSPRYAFVNANLRQTLEVAGSSFVAGTAVQNAAYTNGVNQSFTYGADLSLNAQGLCMQVAGGTYVAGANITLGSCSGASAQKFVIKANAVQAFGNPNFCIDVGTSASSSPAKLQPCNSSLGQNLGAAVQSQYYRYLPQYGIATPMCVDVLAALTTVMPPLGVNACSSALNQSWYINPNGSKLVPYGAGCSDTTAGLLNILGLANYSGQPLYLNACNGSVTQNWQSSPVDASTYQMQWLATGNYCWNVSGNANGSALKLGFCNTANQGQLFSQLAQSFVLQASANAAQCVDVTGGQPIAGAALQFNTCSSSATQSFVMGTDSSLLLGSLCLDVPAGLASGNPVKLASCTYSNSQKWKMVPSSATQSLGVIQSLTQPSLCIDPSAAALGGAVKLASCSGVAAQNFSLR